MEVRSEVKTGTKIKVKAKQKVDQKLERAYARKERMHNHPGILYDIGEFIGDILIFGLEILADILSNLSD